MEPSYRLDSSIIIPPITLLADTHPCLHNTKQPRHLNPVSTQISLFVVQYPQRQVFDFRSRVVVQEGVDVKRTKYISKNRFLLP